MHTCRPARLKQHSYIGVQRYSLTFSADWKRKWFENAEKFIIKSKQCSAHAYAARFGQRLWQPFGYEHVLRDDEKVQVLARYILENPVRAGLAKTVLEYPFLGSQAYDVKELLATLPERD